MFSGIKSIYVITLACTVSLSSCIDRLPLSIDIPDDQFLIECTLEPNRSIRASYLPVHSLKGQTGLTLTDPDTLLLSINEVGKDFAIPFTYNAREQVYKIDSTVFRPSPGTTYALTGHIKGSSYSFNITERVPSLPQIKSITTTHQRIIPYKGDTLEYIIEGVIEWSNIIESQSYYLMQVQDQNKRPAYLDGPILNTNVVTPIHNTPYYLLNGPEANKRIWPFKISLKSPIAPHTLSFTIYHTTESYYRYAMYKNTLNEDGNLMVPNPSIAFFNIKSEQTIGTFNARHLSVFTIEL